LRVRTDVHSQPEGSPKTFVCGCGNIIRTGRGDCQGFVWKSLPPLPLPLGEVSERKRRRRGSSTSLLAAKPLRPTLKICHRHIFLTLRGGAQRRMRGAKPTCGLVIASGGLFLFIAKRKRKEKATKEGAFYKAAPSLETPLRMGKDIPFTQRLASDVARAVVGLNSSVYFRALRAGAANAEHFPNLSSRAKSRDLALTGCK